AFGMGINLAGPTGASAQDDNPLGVDPAAPLDVVIFKGGYSDEYAIFVNDVMWKREFPESVLTHSGIQRLGEQLQPRFVAGNPPDVIDNSGAGNLDMAALIVDGQLASLNDLMAAPAFDTEGAVFADTLLAGSQETQVYDGEQLGLNYVVSATGIWYNVNWLEENGYTYPTTWGEFLDLGDEIKATHGIASFLTTGVHPQYLLGFVFAPLLWKLNPQAMIDIDNMVEGAWQSDSVRTVLENLHQLAERDQIGAGWEGLDHTQSQAAWLEGQAVFLPCGSWLENEMAGLIPEGFDMVIGTVPPIEGSEIGAEGIFSSAGETFIVPSAANNVQGGKEWLRMLFSKEGGAEFSRLTKSLTVVNGAADEVEFGIPTDSVKAAIAAAGENVFASRFGGWYPAFNNEVKLVLLDLMLNRVSVDDFMSRAEELASDVRNDPDIVIRSR
ncbi:MAG: carbohydrate ABC transporter, N-acetylglucosamine/diacetylchitobiose-binding protein, partial [Thermomicrobiales bacterium]|nr:carbohydrate ABC transporter, N-acetylglucosamine/diacetylchitobiose-binding protein [Thermomicrobiales bacterium]